MAEKAEFAEKRENEKKFLATHTVPPPKKTDEPKPSPQAAKK